jgi:hypothetical protein
MDFADVVPQKSAQSSTYEVGLRGLVLIVEAEGSLALTYRDSSSDFDDIVVECMSHVIQVREDECLAHVEAHGNDILCILPCKLLDIVNGKIWLEEKFFVVRQLNDKGDIKYVLKPPSNEFTVQRGGVQDFVKVKGMTWPICMESLDGPRPVYKKNGFFFSYRSRIAPKSLPVRPRKKHFHAPLREKQTPA